MSKNLAVTKFLDEQRHPLRKEIELLRNYVLSADPNLKENVKWNGPNYCYKNVDRITMRIQPPTKAIQLIFHRGASKQKQPAEKLIPDNKMLVWKENDRAIMTFKNMEEIVTAKADIIEIVTDWISVK